MLSLASSLAPWLALLCANAAGATARAVPSPIGPSPIGPAPIAPAQDEELAKEPEEVAALRAAERLAERGRYPEAARAYQRVAERYPDTEAGRIAARRARPSAYLGSKKIVDHGPSSNRVDVALMGDGYVLRSLAAFDKLAESVPRLFERNKTFREYYGYLNFHAVTLVSAENGVDGFGRTYDTALGARTLDTFAGHVGVERARVMEMLEQMPAHDRLAVVFVRNGVLGTGGAGVAVIGGRDAKTLIHEWGHAFANLGDEYATATHERGEVRDRPNVSRTSDPKAVPWAHWIEAGVRGIGVYQGAAGQVRGAWKPTANGCVMEDGEFFCAPCREALVLRIYSLVDPIDDSSPAPLPSLGEQALELREELRFELRVLQPASHELDVYWWLLPERAAAVIESREATGRYASPGHGRSARGPLPLIPGRPTERTRPDRSGVHRLVLRARGLEPGRYRLVVRARDGALPWGERTPWVLKDERGLLESQRAWWIVVPGDEVD